MKCRANPWWHWLAKDNTPSCARSIRVARVSSAMARLSCSAQHMSLETSHSSSSRHGTSSPSMLRDRLQPWWRQGLSLGNSRRCSKHRQAARCSMTCVATVPHMVRSAPITSWLPSAKINRTSRLRKSLAIERQLSPGAAAHRLGANIAGAIGKSERDIGRERDAHGLLRAREPRAPPSFGR
jgi:hypothetical protein